MIKGIVLTVFLALAVALVPLIASGGGGMVEGCGDDCTACHSLTETEAGELLKGSAMAPADSKVKDISIMKTVGLWKVTLDTEGEKPLYIDFGKKNVFVGEFYPLKQPLLESSGMDLLNAK